MGNSQSTDIERLKQLYSMNAFQLESLRKELNQQKEINQQQSHYYKSVISGLQQKQVGLKGRIPENQYDKVDDFLENMNRDIQSQNSEVQSWKSGQQTQMQTNNNSVNRNIGDRNSVNSNIAKKNYSNENNNYRLGTNNQTNQNYQTNQTNQTNQNYQTNHNNQTNKQYDNITKSRNEIDPYSLYGFTKGQPFSIKDLKEKYKQYALKTHPDVNGGNDTNFNIVSNAYKYLLDEHSKMEKDKQYTELRGNSLSFLENQSKSGIQNRELDMNGNNFNVQKFNTVFQDNRLEDTSQEGYSDWINENKYKSDDIVRNSSINSGNFNNQFNNLVKPSKELQVYQLPQELNSRTTNVQELGVDKVDNYSGESGTGSSSIKYTDLKEAHTTSRLVDPNTKYNSYKNIGEVKQARSNMGEISQQEREMIERLEFNQKKQQQQREENQRRMDRMFNDHHSKMNQIFLGGR